MHDWFNSYGNVTRGFARGKSYGQSQRNFPRAHAIFQRISRLESQYIHPQLPTRRIFSQRGMGGESAADQ